MSRRIAFIVVFLLGCALVPPTAHAVINAGLQPYDLVKSRYTNVIGLTIASSDAADASLVARVTESFKGSMGVGTSITMQFAGPLKDVVGDACFAEGRPIAAFVGRRRKSKQLMMYADGFYLGQTTGTNRRGTIRTEIFMVECTNSERKRERFSERRYSRWSSYFGPRSIV